MSTPNRFKRELRRARSTLLASPIDRRSCVYQAKAVWPHNRPHTGPTGRETQAQGRGRRPMPWEKGTPSLRPEGPRDLAPLVLLARTEVLIDIVGHLKRSHDGLPSRGPQTPDQRSRGPSGRIALSISSPQGIGLRPRPWAPFSRPVGPALGVVNYLRYRGA